MKKTLYFLSILACPLSNFGQSFEVAGKAKIKVMETDNTEQDIVVRQTDGTLAVRNAATLQNASSPATYYGSVNICCNSWMTKNLDVDVYRNGDPIPKVEDGAGWAELTSGAYCYYDNDSSTYASIYGKLYNWYAVNDPRGLAPEGWHVPSDFEWTSTSECLGGEAVAGGKMKEAGLVHWKAPNAGATNVSGFEGLPGGFRSSDGTFSDIGDNSHWWSSLEYNEWNAWSRNIWFGNEYFSTINDYDKVRGYSVRCLRD